MIMFYTSTKNRNQFLNQKCPDSSDVIGMKASENHGSNKTGAKESLDDLCSVEPAILAYRRNGDNVSSFDQVKEPNVFSDSTEVAKNSAPTLLNEGAKENENLKYKINVNTGIERFECI